MTQLKEKFRIANIFLLAGTILCLICYDIFGGLWLKGFTSSWFVALGVTNMVFARKAGITDRALLRWILAGLILGMLADVLLGPVFLLGVVFFALGHACYLSAFFQLEKPCRRDLFCALPCIAVTLIFCFCTPFIRVEDPAMRLFLGAYSLILGTMLGKALSNFVANKSTFRGILLLGALLFWFSDLMLGIDMFGHSSRLTWILCSYNYWPAQAFTAHAMYHWIISKQDQTS